MGTTFGMRQRAAWLLVPFCITWSVACERNELARDPAATRLAAAREPLLLAVRTGTPVATDVYLPSGATTASVLLEWTTSREQRVLLSLRSADGTTLPWDDPAVSQLTYDVHFTFANLALSELRARAQERFGAASWTAEITMPDGSAEDKENVRLTVWVDNPMEVQPEIPATIVQGQPLLIRAFLRNGAMPLAGSSDFYVRVTAPSAAVPPAFLPLRDDGRLPDSSPGDGHYAAVLAQTHVLGAYDLSFRLSASTQSGQTQVGARSTVQVTSAEVPDAALVPDAAPVTP